MENQELIVVCYMGGTYGDMVAGLINEDLKTDAIWQVAKPTEEVSKLKKPHTFDSDQEKDEYINSMSSEYKCILSHDQDYHFSRNHSVLGIVVTNMNSALRCAKRFKASHRDQVWEEMMDRCGAKTIKEYAEMMLHYSNAIEKQSKWIISTDEIEDGRVLERIAQIIGTPLSRLTQNSYKNWRSIVIYRMFL
jgi:hypothetical protein